MIQGPAWGPSSDYLRLTLAPLLGDARVITFDPRNVGRSQRVEAEDSQAVEHLVGDLEALRADLGLERFVLVGHSHGGFISMAYAVRHARYLDGLVLLNTTLRRDIAVDEVETILTALQTDPARREAIALFRATGGRVHTVKDDVDMARQMRRLMPAYFYDLGAMHRFGELARQARPPSSAALARVPDDLEPWVEAGLAGIDVPTLVVAGAYDAATPPASSRHISDLIRGSQLEVFEGSAHHPWVEEPELFRHVVGRFLGGLGAGADDRA